MWLVWGGGRLCAVFVSQKLIRSTIVKNNRSEIFLTMIAAHTKEIGIGKADGGVETPGAHQVGNLNLIYKPQVPSAVA